GGSAYSTGASSVDHSRGRRVRDYTSPSGGAWGSGPGSTYSSGWPASTSDPFSTRMSRTVPSTSAMTSLYIFMVSTRPTTSSGSTWWPGCTYGSSSGAGRV